jgi:hypothetical protein
MEVNVRITKSIAFVLGLSLGALALLALPERRNAA